MGLLGHAGWSLGVARRALDQTLAWKDQALGQRAGTPLRDRQDFLIDFGRLDAQVRATRAFTLDTFAEAEEFIDNNEAPTPLVTARCNQAVILCVTLARDTARAAFEWGGVRSIRRGVTERLLRDATVAAQHIGTTRDSFANLTRILIEN
jgi:indole-3-acetate monooxygenase